MNNQLLLRDKMATQSTLKFLFPGSIVKHNAVLQANLHRK